MSASVESYSPSVAELAEARVRLRHARDAGRDWLLSNIAPDGAPSGWHERQVYYRLPWTLSLVGECEPAARVLTWVEANALAADGDLVPGSAQAGHVDAWASYPLSILAIGAHKLERFDLSSRIMDTLERRFVDPQSGGAYSERPEVRATGRQDLFPTAQLGIAAVLTGRDSLAKKNYDFLAAMLEAQPELPTRLYTAWMDGALVVELSPLDEFGALTDFTAPRQAFYNPGIAGAFLGLYYQRYGASLAAQLAQDYMNLTRQGCEAQFDYSDSKQICKYGWGCAVMAQTPYGAPYQRGLLRMASWFADSQLPDGHWENSPFLTPTPTVADKLVMTAEFTQHVSTMLGAVGFLTARMLASRDSSLRKDQS
jgi:hypothetical protein